MYICNMKGDILCPKCREAGRRPKILGKYEDVTGAKGDLYLFCKVCKKEVRIPLESISLDK